MLEAVNSVLQNAPFVKGNIEQLSSVDSFGGNPARVQKAAKPQQAPYISPYISMDIEHDKAVLQIRDSETGDVLHQYPTEQNLRTQEQIRARTREVQQSAPQQQAQRSRASSSAGQSVNVSASQDTGTSAKSSAPATAAQIAAFDTASRSGSTQSTTTVLA